MQMLGPKNAGVERKRHPIIKSSRRQSPCRQNPALRLKFPDQPDHFILLLARDLREHRQRHDATLVGKRIRELLGAMLEAAIGG
jgi:hypothetical protein